MLLVDRLLGDAQQGGDLRPGPPLAACVGDLEVLELLGQPTQGGDCSTRFFSSTGFTPGHSKNAIISFTEISKK